MARNIVKLLSLSLVLCLFSSGALSFGLGDLTKKESSSSVDSGALINQQSGIVKTLVSGLKDYTSGQAQVASALGLKEEAEKLQAESEAIGSGNTNEEDLDRIWGVSESGQKVIDEKVEGGVVLSAEAKKEFAKALPSYAKGTLSSIKLVPDVETFGTSAASAVKDAGLMDAAKLQKNLSTGLYIVEKLPGYITTAKNSYATLIAFSKKNDIDVSKAEDLLGDEF